MNPQLIAYTKTNLTSPQVGTYICYSLQGKQSTYTVWCCGRTSTLKCPTKQISQWQYIISIQVGLAVSHKERPRDHTRYIDRYTVSLFFGFCRVSRMRNKCINSDADDEFHTPILLAGRCCLVFGVLYLSLVFMNSSLALPLTWWAVRVSMLLKPWGCRWHA